MQLRRQQMIFMTPYDDEHRSDKTIQDARWKVAIKRS